MRSEKNGKWGYLDEEGLVAIPFEFDSVHDFKGALAKVSKGGVDMCIDAQGTMVTPHR